MKKLVIIHTSPVSLNELKRLASIYLENVEVVNLMDDSMLHEVQINHGITLSLRERMCKYVKIAEELNADIIMNQCSSVGNAFDIARTYTQIKTLRMDEAMCEKAVLMGERIGVIASVASTLKPSCSLLLKKAAEFNKQIFVKEYLVEGALDILMKENNVEKHNQLCLATIYKAMHENDLIVLAQGSMTVLLPYLHDICVPVLSSPELAMKKVANMLSE